MDNGFDAMGKPIPAYRREEAYRTCREEFGLSSEYSWSVVTSMSQALERDNPHIALESALSYIDLTGAYRIMAVLLTAPKPRVRVEARST